MEIAEIILIAVAGLILLFIILYALFRKPKRWIYERIRESPYGDKKTFMIQGSPQEFNSLKEAEASLKYVK